jgi:hypothetical protein
VRMFGGGSARSSTACSRATCGALAVGTLFVLVTMRIAFLKGQKGCNVVFASGAEGGGCILRQAIPSTRHFAAHDPWSARCRVAFSDADVKQPTQPLTMLKFHKTAGTTASAL